MKIVFKLLIFLWISIAFLNVFYNSKKTIAEFRDWAPLSDSEKRYKLFGDLYDFIVFTNLHTDKNSSILIYSDADMTHLLSRYYLYPKNTYTTNNKDRVITLVKSNKYDYLAVYNDLLPMKQYKRIARYSSKISSKKGYLYKLK